VQTTPADIRNAILLSVTTVAAGFLVPVFPFVGIPLAAFALGWITYRFGPRPASVLAVATAACVGIAGPWLLGTSVLDGLFVAVVLLGVGPVTVNLLRRHSSLAVAGGVTLVITAAVLAAPIGAQTLNELVTAWRLYMTMPTAAGVSVSNAATMKTTIVWLIAQTTAMWPALTFYTMGVGTVVGVSLVARAGRSLGVPVKGYGPLADIDMSFHLVWPAILGLGLMALGTLWHQAPALVATVGENVWMIVRPVLFLQGAAVFAALYKRMGAGRVLRTIGLVLLVLTELLVPSVSLLGLVDLFANLRKLPRADTRGPRA
jgi:uncharacterized protein YybS (DUF2232 family)